MAISFTFQFLIKIKHIKIFTFLLPLRIISRFESLQIISISLIFSIKLLKDILIMLIIFIFIGSVFSLQTFQGINQRNN